MRIRSSYELDLMLLSGIRSLLHDLYIHTPSLHFTCSPTGHNVSNTNGQPNSQRPLCNDGAPWEFIEFFSNPPRGMSLEEFVEMKNLAHSATLFSFAVAMAAVLF